MCTCMWPHIKYYMRLYCVLECTVPVCEDEGTKVLFFVLIKKIKKEGDRTEKKDSSIFNKIKRG